MTPRLDHESLAESDAAALAASLLDCLDRHPGEVAALVDAVPAGVIADPIHGPIVDAIRGAVAAGVTPTVGDVSARLREAGHDDGSPVRIAFNDALHDYVNTGRRAIDTARGAAERLKRRYVDSVAREAAERYATSPDAGTLAELREALAAVEAGFAAARPLPTAIDAIDRWARHERTPTVATGFPWFDEPTEGGLPVGLTVLAAPPERGKSALALQLTVGALLADCGIRATWAAGEMPLAGIGRRLVTVGSGLVEGAEPVTMYAAGEGTPRARKAAVRIAEAIGDRLTFVEPPLTVAAIDASVSRSSSRLLVVDYLQLVTVPDGGRDRVADLDRLVGQLRDLAIRRELAVVLVSSMPNRATPGDHAGLVGRGTSEIGYAAELVYAGQREDDPSGKPVIGPDGMVAVHWRCKKARNAEPRDLVLRFDGRAQTFYADAADTSAPPIPTAALGTAPLDAWQAPEAAT